MKQIIRFTASWCQPCKVYAPTFEKAASEIDGANFETIDVDSGDPRIIQYGVRNVPTTIVIENGNPIKRQTGNLSFEQLKELTL